MVFKWRERTPVGAVLMKMRLIVALAAFALMNHETAFAACKVEKKIGATWLCVGGKALYQGKDKQCWRGTWQRLTATTVQICLPNEQCKSSCQVKKG
jgi:hypothetical protein